MDSKIIEQLLQQDEGPKLDFKRKLHEIDHQDKNVSNQHWHELIKDILSITNGNTGTAGETGYLIFGASDTRRADGKRDLYDTGTVSLTARQILDRANKLCKPQLPDLLCGTATVEGTNLFYIAVPPSPYLHYTSDWLKPPRAQYCPNVAFLRRKDGEEIYSATREEEDQIRIEKKLLTQSTAQRNTGEPALAGEMRSWFEALGYTIERAEPVSGNRFDWIISFPIRGRRDRIAIRGVVGEGQMSDITDTVALTESLHTDEGWVISSRRISIAAREKAQTFQLPRITCYTFDELIDQDADFTPYFQWLTQEVERKGIDKNYIPLACKKEEFDPKSKAPIGESTYGEEQGWIEAYIDTWIDDPAKEHISILGEFGTGKTWFSLHYAWRLMCQYLDEQRRGVERSRLPIVIPLRDYSGAFDVENVVARFFFSKHNIRINSDAFNCLNRMGKLLLIFDGFDEMAERVDRQKMINNFWQLAKLVVPGSKAILTCRTEHFPHAQEGRALLNAELKASVASLTGEPPQFEVLELQHFQKRQIRKAILSRSSEFAANRITRNSDLMELARRPVMIDLILEALPEIDQGLPVDISRVYLYAIRTKMNRDIKAVRTFTSLADKTYFMCELSWEMLSTDRMNINYRLFPDKLLPLKLPDGVSLKLIDGHPRPASSGHARDGHHLA